MSHPQLPEDVIQNTKVVYYRFHGIPHLYSSPYELSKLTMIADEIHANTVLEPWYNESDGTFSFSVKAPRLITHYKKFIETKRMVQDFYGTVQEGLKEKLGCVLFQMPPQMVYKEEKLEQIIDNLDLLVKNVLEFRHESCGTRRSIISSQNMILLFVA